MKKAVLMAAVFGCAFTATAEWSSFGSGWRITAGPSMNAAAKSSVRVNGAALRGALPAVATSGGDGKSEAQRKGDALERGERLEFPDGGFIDPTDAAGVAGETWNWRMPAGSLSGSALSAAHYYSGVESVGLSSRGADSRDCDRDAMLGFSLGFDKEIGRWGGFGVDFGFLFSYYRKRDLVKTRATFARRVDRETGAYVTDVPVDPELAADPWFANADGSYGAGSFAGPGPVLSLDGVSHRWANVNRWSETDTARIGARGDYEEYALQFALKPWYEVCDWFRVFGTIGLELSHAELEMRGVLWTDGARIAGGHTSREWDLCGVAGAGGMFRFKGVCLGAEAQTRFGDDRLRVRAPGVDGHISRADLTCRVWLGYEF